MTEVTEESRAHACAQIIEEIRKVEYTAAWALRDFCKDIVERNDEGFLRRVAKELDWSRRTLEDFAYVAAYFPPDTRSGAHSPITHAKWMRKDKKRLAAPASDDTARDGLDGNRAADPEQAPTFSAHHTRLKDSAHPEREK